MNCAIRFLFCLSSLLLPLSLPLSASYAQQPPQPANTGRADTLRLEQRRQLERQMIEKALAEQPAGARRSPRLVLAEFRADFLSLQITNNELFKSVSTTGPLDLKFVAKSAAEIRRLGKRLKTNLIIPKTEGAAQHSTISLKPGLEHLHSSLTTLDSLILDFVSNPVFESAKVVDIPLSTKARRHLEEIIALSGLIKKSSEKLSVATSRSR
jgi:hypothetical protein